MLTIGETRQQLDEALGGAVYRALIWAGARACGVEERAQIFDDVRVPFYDRAGDGRPPLLMLHGFGGDKEGWLGMAAFLDRGRGLILPDLPGFGAAGAIPRRRATARAQAAVMRSLLDRLGVSRVHVVGNSMGGGIAQRLAYDAPARVASLTLIGSMGPDAEPSEFALALAAGQNPLLATDAVDFDRMLHLVAERVPPLPRVIRRYLGADHARRREDLARLFPALTHPAAGQGLPEPGDIAAPTLVVHGEHDRVIHPSTGRALHDGLPNARLELLDGLGHIPHLEDPRRMARTLEAFLRTLPEG